MKKVLKIIGALLFSALVGLLGYIGWSLYPHQNVQLPPAPLVAVDSAEGQQRLRRAAINADYPLLAKHFEPQRLASYCGVASSVITLNALGFNVSQWGFFTEQASQVRSQLRVMLGGMSLPELAGLLKAHGLRAAHVHADSIGLPRFREVLRRNIADPYDVLLANYQRQLLGQGKVGHISPVAAYDEASDSALILDTAAHKYGFTWVPVDMLYAAIRTSDSASGLMRGYVEVSRGN